jgi:hypothetical protein
MKTKYGNYGKNVLVRTQIFVIGDLCDQLTARFLCWLALCTGLVAGMRVMMVASRQGAVEEVRAQRELPRMRGFEEEAALAASRRRSSRTSVSGPPVGEQYTFGAYEAWEYPGLHPPKQAALQLLHRLASDRGIMGIMRKHRWSVGLLKEMPPEGKVGVSPVCILGLNVNRGQEIHLRLRTDDLRGFRRYRSIRDTLCHELAHMVWGEHDNNFKMLNSQLQRECNQLSWTEVRICCVIAFAHAHVCVCVRVCIFRNNVFREGV